MNLCIADPSGMLHNVSADEAREHLGDVAKAQVRTPTRYLGGLLDATRIATVPESHYDNELYQPAGYEPGWVNP